MDRERRSNFSALELHSDRRRRADYRQGFPVLTLPFILSSGEFSGVVAVNPVADLTLSTARRNYLITINKKSTQAFKVSLYNVSGKVIAQSIAFRLVAIYWQGVSAFH